MKTSELTGAALDWAVAKCEGAEIRDENDGYGLYCYFDESEHYLGHCPLTAYKPSTDWAQGGPIIEREGIDLHHHRHGDLSVGWDATIDSWDSEHSGPTPLIAAMRCYVASKLGDEVEVPA